MANIEIALDHPIRDGETIEFTSPYDCTAVAGLIVSYPVDEEGTKETKTFTLRDAHGNDLTGLANVFSAGAYIKVIVNIEDDYAYIQNGDTNAYLEERFGNQDYLPISGGTISGNLTVSGTVTANGMLILNQNSYGTELPAAGNKGRLFLVEVS